MKDLLKLIVCWFAFVLSIFITGFITQLLHLQTASLQNANPMVTQLLAQCFAGALLVIGLYAMARQLTASAPVRALAFVGFLLFAFGINGIIEAKKFTNFLDAGVGAAVAFYITLAVVLGTAMGLLFGSAGQPAGFPRRSWPAWLGRGAAAWLGWPVIYFIFGMCIAPIVIPYYSAGIAGLRIPPVGVVFEMQLIRSLFFLAASLPFIALWKGSRRGLWLALGLAHDFTVGIYGLAGASFLPMILRVTHGIEITCDSFAYAGLLVLLFSAPAAAKVPIAQLPQDPHPLPL